jgi:hypothetical protein
MEFRSMSPEIDTKQSLAQIAREKTNNDSCAGYESSYLLRA